MLHTQKNNFTHSVSNGRRGFTLVEILVVISIFALIAFTAIPQYLYSQKRNNLKSTFAEIQSVIKSSRNYGLTGEEAEPGVLPTGGYGVYFETENSQVTSFVDDGDPPDFFFGDGESTSDDILKFNKYIGVHEIQARADGTCRALYDASIVYQPLRSEAIVKGRIDESTFIQANLIDSVVLSIKIEGSEDPDDILTFEVFDISGKLEPNPDPCV